MFGKAFVRDLITRSAQSEQDRRNFLRSASLAGMGVVGAGVLGGAAASSASAASTTSPEDEATDAAVLNFALNLEYLEAEFYHFAVYGTSIAANLTTGSGRHGTVTGGSKVPWKNDRNRKFAMEIANDELAHVKFLRAALDGGQVSEPDIDLQKSFTAAAMAAGVIKQGQTFDPFSSDDAFLLGAYIFEDVGVTAYKGAAPLISNPTYLEAAAGILAVEAYHAGNIRTRIVESGLSMPAIKISMARDSLDGSTQDDQGPIYKGINITPTDDNAIAFSRSTEQVLNVVYLTPKKATAGGFFPSGVNGAINTSGANG